MFVGIDVGTSEVKVLLMDQNGQIIGQCGNKLTVSRPYPMWSEQDPSHWWHATDQAMQTLANQYPQQWRKVQSIGLSGQMHGAVLLDKAHHVLRPAILWNDVRSFAQCAELTNKVPRIHGITGNLAMPGFTAPKLLWIAQHEPQCFEQTACVLLPKDYLRFLMTGEKVSDLSDAAGTLWLDVARRDWSDEMLAATNLSRAQMPRLVEGNALSAYLSAEIATRWQLPQKVIVAGGAGDNAASAIGIGAVQEGDGFISLGTSGVLFVANNNYRPNVSSAVHTFCHALPQRWHQMSVMLSAASNLQWICRVLGTNESHLLNEVAQLSNPNTAPLFLPYLSGERTPHNDPYAQGVFFGLTHETSRAHFGYAVLEGVSFGLLDGLKALQSANTQVKELSLVGGGSRSDYWAQLLANLMQVPIITHTGSEAGGALGAARLGALAFGLSQQEVCCKPPVAHRFEPSPLTDSSVRRYEQFKALYKHNKTLFQDFFTDT